MKSFALLCTFAIALKLKEFDGEWSGPFQGLSFDDLKDIKTAQFDQNGNGELDDDEWINLASDFEAKMDGTFDNEDWEHYNNQWNKIKGDEFSEDNMDMWLTDTFSAKHGDEYGAVDREGAKKFANAMFGYEPSDEEIEQYFNFLDFNGDDKLDLGEQDQFWKNLIGNGECWEDDCPDYNDPIWIIRDAAHRILDETDRLEELKWQIENFNSTYPGGDFWGGYNGDDMWGGYNGDDMWGGYNGDDMWGGYNGDDMWGGYNGDDMWGDWNSTYTGGDMWGDWNSTYTGGDMLGDYTGGDMWATWDPSNWE